MSQSERPYALDVPDRANLDEEMTALVRGIEKKYGFMPNFLKFFKTDNQRLRAFIVPYLELLRADSGLSATEHEMIALVSAATNGCVYCQIHHTALVREQTGDPVFAEYLSRNYHLAELSPRHLVMLDYVVKVLTDAESINDGDRDALRDAGFTDETIWNITSTACFYASANRMTQAIGLRPAPEYLDMYRTPAAQSAAAAG
jgi:uncharacterized peroxidase-related enzyme